VQGALIRADFAEKVGVRPKANAPCLVSSRCMASDEPAGRSVDQVGDDRVCGAPTADRGNGLLPNTYRRFPEGYAADPEQERGGGGYLAGGIGGQPGGGGPDPGGELSPAQP
jgi:hypothetical protein